VEQEEPLSGIRLSRRALKRVKEQEKRVVKIKKEKKNEFVIGLGTLFSGRRASTLYRGCRFVDPENSALKANGGRPSAGINDRDLLAVIPGVANFGHANTCQHFFFLK
jgi:hypothetical protein